MTTAQLREAHRDRPFRPLRLQLADGNEVHAPDPECLSYRGKGRTTAVAIADGWLGFTGIRA